MSRTARSTEAPRRGPKALWINTFRSTGDPDALARYAERAGPAMTAHGGRFLARGIPAAIFEAAVRERTVVIEFPSVEDAVAAYHSLAYQAALSELGDEVVRDLRVVATTDEPPRG